MCNRIYLFAVFRFLSVFAAGFILFIPLNSAGQGDEIVPAKELATTQLMKQVKELLEHGRAAEAVPYLEESLIRFKELEGGDFASARAEAMYQLSLCYMETEQFVSAADCFQRFVRTYPDHAYAMVSRILTLESLARLNDPGRMTSYIDQLEHNGDFDLLATALKDPANSDTCRHALVALMQAYAQAANLDGFNRFLPYCDDDALSDRGLNYALIEGGELAVEQERFMDALQWFRLVKTGPELMSSLDRRLAALKVELDTPAKWVAQKERGRHEAQRAMEQQRYETMQAERTDLEENSYDLDLMLRLAQCYDAMGRHWIAISVFQHIYTEYPESRVAERCRYFSFSSMMGMKELVRARDEGRAYIDQYPLGRFRDEITLSLMHVELGLENLDRTDELGRALLVQEPIHRYVDQVNYLLGFVKFKQASYDAAIPFFQETATAWPTRMYAEEATYWVGMCTLFLGEYQQAVDLFEHYLEQSSWSPKAFAEDVTYRLGMAYYGLESDEAAKRIFTDFLAQFPQSDLISEAASMLGDLYGGEGDLERALDYYAQARKVAVNSTQLDYAVFQAAKAYELLSCHSGIIELMTEYLQPSDRVGRYADAGVWLSKSLRATGAQEKALDACCDTLIRYATDPQADGFGALIDEILVAVQDPPLGAVFRERAKRILEPVRVTTDSKTLGLYLTVLFADWSDADDRVAYDDSLMEEASFDAFAPLHLLRFAEVAAQRQSPNRVRQAYDYFVENFETSEQALEMANIGIASSIEAKDYTAAFALADSMIEAHSAESAAALTHKLAGDALRLMARYDEAIEMYSQLLKVRAWRGPLTPESLYWSAVCKRSQGDTEKAFAYFQRVYVLYGQYPEWVAKAYAGSVACLRELGREDELIRTWREMLAIPEVAARPEGREAQAGLDAWVGEGK